MHMQSARCNDDVPEARPGLHPTTSLKAGSCITAKSAARLPKRVKRVISSVRLPLPLLPHEPTFCCITISVATGQRHSLRRHSITPSARTSIVNGFASKSFGHVACPPCQPSPVGSVGPISGPAPIRRGSAVRLNHPRRDLVRSIAVCRLTLPLLRVGRERFFDRNIWPDFRVFRIQQQPFLKPRVRVGFYGVHRTFRHNRPRNRCIRPGGSRACSRPRRSNPRGTPRRSP